MIKYWIEDQNLIWMKGNIAANGTNVYLLQKTPGYVPDTSTFDFFSDFANLDQWTNESGTPANTKIINLAEHEGQDLATVDGYVLTLEGTRTVIDLQDDTIDEIIKSVATFDANTIVEGRLCHAAYNNMYFGYYDTSRSNACLWITNATSSMDTVATINVSTTISNDNVDRTGTTFYKYGIVYKTTEIMYYVNDSYRRSVLGSIPTGVMPIYIRSEANKGKVTVDWVRVRKYASTEPTVTVIDEGSYYRIVVKNNINENLLNYQFHINALSIGGVSETESLGIVPIMQQPIKTVDTSSLFSNCRFYLDFNANALITNIMGTVNFNSSALLSPVGDRFNIKRAIRCYYASTPYFVYGTNDDMSLSGDFCIFVIIKLIWELSGNNYIMCKIDSNYKGYQCYLDSSNYLKFKINLNLSTYYIVTSTGAMSQTEYLYIGCQRRGSYIDIYINGNLNNSVLAVNTDITPAVPTLICKRSSVLFGAFQMDVSMGWNRSLTAGEHKYLYDAFKQRYIYPADTEDQQRGF